ncbi:hypothetical protein ACFY2H_31495 [Streptomyces griseofuscus]|uniref:hypothetical protein n=1 Tax=Streptomycetaceae TaxID=2062 RepID=UPI000689FD27|nr:hypothetical protein [Actinacidiphila yeochonensis]
MTAPTVQLITVESTAYGPYAGLLPKELGGYDAPLFTRRGAQHIVDDLHRDACGLSAAWEGESLRFTWTKAYRGDDGTEVVHPDRHGRYAIGGLWPWMEWDEELPHTAGQRAFADGVRQARAPRGPVPPEGLRHLYDQGRAEAQSLTLLPLLTAVPAGCGDG